MIVLDYPQGSEDWLKARVGAATASRFSDARQMVGGLNEQQTLFVQALKRGVCEEVAMQMAGYRAKPRSATIAKALAGMPVQEPGAAAIKYAWLIAFETIAREPLDDTFVTYAMRRGRDLEPQARAVYEARTGAWIEEVSLILTDDERFGYSADGFRDDDGLIEIKCPLACDKLGQVWEHPEEAHLEYIDQINGGLWITGRKYCDLIVYCPWLAPVGKDLFIKRIWRNDDAINELEGDLLNFMAMVDRFLAILRRPTKMSGAPKDAPDEADPALAPWDDAAPAEAPTPAPARASKRVTAPAQALVARPTPAPLPANIF